MVVVAEEEEEERRMEVSCDRSSEDAANTCSDGRDEADATTDLYCFSSDDRDMCEVAKECDCGQWRW